MAHVAMLCQLMGCLLNPTHTPPDCPKEWYDLYFVFACVWAFGSAMFQEQAVDYRVGVYRSPQKYLFFLYIIKFHLNINIHIIQFKHLYMIIINVWL